MTKEELKNTIRSLAPLRSMFPIQYYKNILAEVERLENDIKNPKIATEQDIERIIKKLSESMTENLKYRPDDIGIKAELDFYIYLLPAQLSEKEVEEIIAAKIAELNLSSKKDKGVLMKALKDIKGIDMKVAGKIIDEKLK